MSGAGMVEAVSKSATLLKKLEFESAQGVLPLTNSNFHEQANPMLRSSLFSTTNRPLKFDDWTEMFCLGGTIKFKGPQITVDHEVLFTHILCRARGRSLTKPVSFHLVEALQWMNMADTGPNRSRIRRMLEDLKSSSIRIFNKRSIQRLLQMLTRTDLDTKKDGLFLKQLIENTYKEYVPLMMESLQDGGQPFEIEMDFISRKSSQGKGTSMFIELDPMLALFFDGVNTTLLPFEIYKNLDKLGKKVLMFIASHRDGVFPMQMKNYFHIIGSNADFSKMSRKFKQQLTECFTNLEAQKYIHPGWEFYKNSESIWMVKGVRGTEEIRIKAAEALEDENQGAEDIDYNSLYDEMDGRTNSVAPAGQGHLC